jgi:hypothetical protein
VVDTLALEDLYNKVVARFTAEGPIDVLQPFGWREPVRQIPTSQGGRIVWTPGDPAAGHARRAIHLHDLG